MMNSVYGKAIENLQKRISVRLVTNKKSFLKCTSRVTHITHKIFDKNFAAIHETKPVLILKKPIYVEFSVQELSNCCFMTSIAILLERILMLSCYLLTQTVLLIK